MRTAAAKPKRKAFRLGPAASEGNIITLTEANALCQEITGRRKSLKVLADIIHERPHLGLFDFPSPDGRPRFLGVRRDRWRYFLQTRLALCGRRGIFHDHD